MSDRLFHSYFEHRIVPVLMNFYPVLGVLFFDWNVFAIFYVYWLETLAIAFFTALSIALYNSEPGGWWRACRFMVLRSLVLLFYLIFIVVFIGVIMASTHQKGYEWLTFLTFVNDSFRYSILILFIIKLIRYVGQRDQQQAYRSLSLVFDGRQIVIHVTIILGFFAYTWFSDLMGNHVGLVVFTAVFATIKSIVELFTPKSLVS